MKHLKLSLLSLALFLAMVTAGCMTGQFNITTDSSPISTPSPTPLPSPSPVLGHTITNSPSPITSSITYDLKSSSILFSDGDSTVIYVGHYSDGEHFMVNVNASPPASAYSWYFTIGIINNSVAIYGSGNVKINCNWYFIMVNVTANGDTASFFKTDHPLPLLP
jgi:hypothetical protein